MISTFYQIKFIPVRNFLENNKIGHFDVKVIVPINKNNPFPVLQQLKYKLIKYYKIPDKQINIVKKKTVEYLDFCISLNVTKSQIKNFIKKELGLYKTYTGKKYPNNFIKTFRLKE